MQNSLMFSWFGKLIISLLENETTMKASNKVDRIRSTPKESGVFARTLEKREELQENLVYTGKRRSFKVTLGKREGLRERLVEIRGTPAKDGEIPERRGESKFRNLHEHDFKY